MIISGGFNVYPAEVERVLRSHEAVAECAVIGIPHADWGEAVVAVIEARPGADSEELREFLRTQVGGIKTPK